MRLSPFEGLALVVPFAFLLFWLALIVVHIVFALAVFRHSSATRDGGSELVFAAPGIWALATLVTGVLGATCYWLLHCSSIRPAPYASAHEAPPPTSEPSAPHA